MILPSGTPTGPYMSNSDSTCGDQSYTPLGAGTDRGLISGGYQSTPTPPFDKSGNALAGRITAPAQFYGTAFATSSNPVDPQTGRAVPAPRIYANGSRLTANLDAPCPVTPAHPPERTTRPPARSRWTGPARWSAVRSTSSPGSGISPAGSYPHPVLADPAVGRPKHLPAAW
jgi:hypothetical protein